MSATLCNQLLSSCINSIPEEMPKAGNAPIFLRASFKDMSRVATSDFDGAIGLYITIQPSTIDKTRYVDNMKFSYDPSNDCFSPEETIFFPEGNSLCDFTGYYPYKEDAINKGESSIKVEVQTDQSDKTALTASDFMIATTTEVTTSKDPVALDFHHKLSLLNIRLKSVSGYTVETLMESNPIVRIKNVYTQAIYDFKTDKFTGHHTKADIIPYGSWKEEDGMLYGKSAIIIPQTLPQSHVIFELYVNGRLFECKMECEYILGSGVAENNTIVLQSSDDPIKNTICTNISDWNVNDIDTQWTANETSTVLQTSQLDFTASNVFKVMNKEKQIAEICLEYLRTDEIDKQAVVIYPMNDGKTDLTKGLVIELKGEANDKHGGSVLWNSTNNLTYTEGASAIIPYIYITENGEIKTIRPVNALQLQLKPDLLVDNRRESIIEYPIVKIGTQYWTRMNCKTTIYTDGTGIAYGGGTDLTGEGVAVNNNAPQYYNLSTYLYYNAASVATGNLIPDGWRVGNETDYDLLKTYVQDNAAVLKNNELTWGESSCPITNLTGFNGTGIGYFNKKHTNAANVVAYWCANNGEPYKVDKMVTLYAGKNNITIGDATVADMALAIRYVRN
ncbi:MAG: fimbrillin family protein [Mediterranea sp.]|nr:fimbrillin family protein [Mediterranea sp.]